MATQSPESNAPTPPPEPETKAKDSTITKASFESLEHDVNVGRRVTAAKHPQAIFAKNPEAWPRLSKTLENHDEAKIGSYKEDIDTLLVFAGLFSAVLAAFIVEAYKLLQPESGQLTIQLLSQISQQLNSFTVNPAFVNSTLQTTVPIQISSDFKPSTSVFFVNLLWFLALILCLVTASLGMLVKQWLREYLANDSTSPQALARIRFSRLRSLETWHVFSIASALPTLLQLALTFFLIALCLFVHQFHYALFCCITTVVAMFFVFYAYLMFAPLFSSRCPYKSPSLKSTTQSIRRGIHVSIRKILEANELWKKSLAFLDPGPLVEESTLRVKSDQDAVIWSEADKLSFDDRLVKDTIATCLADVDGESAIHCVQGLIERRELRAEPSNLLNYGQDSISLLLTDALLREMRTQINESERLDWKPWMGEAYLLLLDNWQYCSDDIGKNHLADFLFAVIRRDWLISDHILRWKPQISLAVLSFALKDRNERLRNFPAADILHLFKKVKEVIEVLFSHGPLPTWEFSEAPTGAFFNIADAIQTLFCCASNIALLHEVTEKLASRKIFHQIASDIERVVDIAIITAQEIVDKDDDFRQWTTAKDTDWGMMVVASRRYESNLRTFGAARYVNPKWEDAFSKLRDDCQKRRSDLAIA